MNDLRHYGCRHCGFRAHLPGPGGSATCPVCSVAGGGSYARGVGDNDHLQLRLCLQLRPDLLAEPARPAEAHRRAAQVALGEVSTRFPPGDSDPVLAEQIRTALHSYLAR